MSKNPMRPCSGVAANNTSVAAITPAAIPANDQRGSRARTKAELIVPASTVCTSCIPSAASPHGHSCPEVDDQGDDEQHQARRDPFFATDVTGISITVGDIGRDSVSPGIEDVNRDHII